MPELVFVSYNRKDGAAAQRIALFLAAENLKVWFDKWEIQAGDSIVQEIQRGLEGCTHFWILWSANASQSRWVTRELSAILTRAIESGTPRVIPLKLDDTPLPPLLADLKFVRFHGGTERDRYQIIRAVTGNAPASDFTKAIVRKYHELIRDEKGGDQNPFGLSACPECGDKRLTLSAWIDPEGEFWTRVTCSDCGWFDMTQA
jgi:hypothetical protein